MKADAIVWDGAEIQTSASEVEHWITTGAIVAIGLAIVIGTVSAFYIECFDFGWFNSCWPF